MRRRRGGLVNTMARTAVIAGTATAVSGAVAGKQQGKVAQQQANQQAAMAAQQQAMMEAQNAQAALAAQQAAAPGGDDMVARLEKLGELYQKGILTDEEFAAQKAKILG